MSYLRGVFGSLALFALGSLFGGASVGQSAIENRPKEQSRDHYRTELVTLADKSHARAVFVLDSIMNGNAKNGLRYVGSITSLGGTVMFFERPPYRGQ